LRKLIVLLLAFAAVISLSPLVFAAGKKTTAKVLVYYFHGTFRCNACTSMEKWSKETIESHYKSALASRKIEFKVVNVEKYGNEHFVNEYQLYTKSLVLALVKDGKEVKFKNLELIWEYAGNRQSFINYVTTEVNAFLKEA